jgi:acyl transferase domain-containing protein
MSGFVAMAVEAAAQRAASRNIQYESFDIRDVVVTTPLMVTEDDVEMTLQLRPHDESSADVADEFRIHSYANGKGWTEHCKGIISVTSNVLRGVGQTQAAVLDSAKTEVEKGKIYESLSELGVEYGPTFQGMNSCQSSDSASTATIATADTSLEMVCPSSYLFLTIPKHVSALSLGAQTLALIWLVTSQSKTYANKFIAKWI